MKVAAAADRQYSRLTTSVTLVDTLALKTSSPERDQDGEIMGRVDADHSTI
jgi:hypothetical protein